MTTVFQRVLNDIDRQRVHLGATGLSTSDLVFFLRQCSLEDLRGLLSPHLAHPIRPLFVLTDLLTDQAEYELLRRKRPGGEWCELPQALDSPTSPPASPLQFTELSRLLTHLGADARTAIPLAEVVPWGSFEESAYRLSMLSLLGDAEAARNDGPVGTLASLPFTLAALPSGVGVGRAGVATISAGHLHRLPASQQPLPSPLMGEGTSGGAAHALLPPPNGKGVVLATSSPLAQEEPGQEILPQEPSHVP